MSQLLPEPETPVRPGSDPDAAEAARRLDDARERLRRDIPPPAD